jgi:hypothetical protein
MKYRKSQIQSSETIFAVFIIIIIIIIALVFYSRAQEGKLKEAEREQRSLRMISLAHTITSWPELECSVLNSRDFNCIDAVKLDLLQEFIKESKNDDSYAFKYYSDVLRRSTITVTEVYSFSGPLRTWVVYNNSFASRSQEAVYIPVNVYYPLEQRRSYAIMELKVYE